ncbi:MAG: hypothetical protein HDS10_03110 [Bacteroides sp.]|nr:hypothetical protein [Bacteroides sp.]
MRKIFTLSLLLAATAASARQISPDEALSAANAFLNSKSLTPVEASGAMTRSDAQPYYAFNATDGNGFVIISGDDRYSKVLGYSDRGSFDFKNMPPQLKAMLDQFAENSAKPSNWNGTHSSWNNSFSATRADEGVLLETAKWGQDAPYNADCPNMGESNAPTGCVATAMAIVMKYHNWPETYNWDAMPMEITEENPAPNPELARLMKDAGEAVFMSYGAYESGANMGWVGQRLRHVFSYSPNCQYIRNINFSHQEWVELIREHLNNKNPLIYSGADENGLNSHAFIIDGYKGDDYHINFGWNGASNGYYALDSMLGFEHYNGMVINAVPDKEGLGQKYSECFIDPGYMLFQEPQPLNISAINVKQNEPFHISFVTLAVPKGFEGEIGVALVDKAQNIKEVLKTNQHTTHFPTGDNSYTAIYDYTDLIITKDIDPTDRIQVVSKRVDENEYKLLLGSLEKKPFLPVVKNSPLLCNIKFHIGEGVEGIYAFGSDYHQLPKGKTTEINVLKGLYLSYEFSPEEKESENPVILKLKTESGDGDFISSGKILGNSIPMTEQAYEIEVNKIDLIDKKIDNMNASELDKYITEEEGPAVRDLIISGKMNGYDFKFILDNCPSIRLLDISKVTIEETPIDEIFNVVCPANAIPDHGLRGYYGSYIETLILPENLEHIGNYSLLLLKIHDIIIPRKVNYIGINAFLGDRNLNTVCMLNPEPIPIGDDVFTDTQCPENGTLYVPVGSAEKYKQAPVWKDFKNIIEGEISSGVDKISISVTEQNVLNVFTIDGLQLLKNVSKEDLNRLANGVYIIREGNRSRKVFIKK